MQILDGHQASVGALSVRRVLPQRQRRTIGPWCFADHIGPADVDERHGLDIGPHPHSGLHTVTWLTEGAVLHRDSLGTEQVITPGQVNLMSAGEGVSHSEEATGSFRGTLQGIQLWLAQPESTRHGPSSFHHVAEPPRVDLGRGLLTAFIGDYAGQISPARVETPTLGAEVEFAGHLELELRPDFEYALICLKGEVTVERTPVAPGRLGVLSPQRDSVHLESTHSARAILIGGAPFSETLLMWRNFVARTREEIALMRRAWSEADGRYGRLSSPLARIEAPELAWTGRAEPLA